MRYIVGFDLGTHQTKICIQDAINPAEKIYEFLEFEKPDGSTTVLFPSVVQINTDETISYGFVDDRRCLELNRVVGEKPSLKLTDLPPAPTLPTPKKANYPKKPTMDPWIDTLRKIKGEKTSLEKWEKECAKIDETIHTEWNEQCTNIMAKYKKEYETIQAENQNIQSIYEKKLNAWKKAQKKEHLSFRYFKLRAFTGSGDWNSLLFSEQEITVWYITYLLILLKEKLGPDFSIQFGIPVGGSKSKKDRAITSRAYNLYIAAYKLSEIYKTKNVYLKATYKDLRKNTNICAISKERTYDYNFDDLPEAFAGLIAVTIQKKLDMGFHMLADIGGGTTDMALFYVDRKTLSPDVISIQSFAKGLNFIFENTHRKPHQSLANLQELFFRNPDNEIFSNAIQEYKKALLKTGEDLEKDLCDHFNKSYDYHGKSQTCLTQAIRRQPIIYCGGGSVYKHFHQPIKSFTDVRKINKEMLNIRYIRNEKKIPNNLYPILAISYGLASYEKIGEDSITVTDISEVFEKCLPPREEKHNPNEYGLLDD